MGDSGETVSKSDEISEESKEEIYEPKPEIRLLRVIEVDSDSEGISCDDRKQIDSGEAEDSTEGRPFFEPQQIAQKPFIYKDWDSLQNELCELYGYYEINFLQENKECYMNAVKSRNISAWSELHQEERVNIVNDLLDLLEIVDETKQLNAILALKYLLQGCWAEFPSMSEQLQWLEWNAKLILECDGFKRVWTLFSALSENVISQELRLELDMYGRILDSCLHIMCTIVYVAISQRKMVAREEEVVYQALIDDLLVGDGALNENILAVLLETLIEMVEYSPRCFLIKPLVLLVRSILLLTVGGTEELRKTKETCREMVGLRTSKEDTILHCQAEIDPLQNAPMWNCLKARQTLMTWTEFTELSNAEERSTQSYYKKSFPWTPKSSLTSVYTSSAPKNDLTDECIQISCGKAQIFSVPVKQRLDLLLKNLYVPLSSFQIEQENLISRYPITFGILEKPFVDNIETIFSALLPLLESFSRCMVRLLSEATPRTLMTDLFVPRVSDVALPSSADESIRQAEIVAKAVSTILILVLKYTKINHIYQFECIAAEFVAASFIPIVLRYFNRDVMKYLTRRPVTPDPYKSEFKVLTVEIADQLDGGDACEQLSQRNMHTCINLLRVITKLAKGKPSRILMLRMFKAPDCLKHCLKVSDPLFQQYVLKLLKMQCKYLGKEWKRSNQQIISAIFLKVRHRFLDDWVGGKTEIKSWPWECHEEEKILHENVLLYLNRKYNEVLNWRKINSQSENQMECKMSESFKTSFETWLQNEVFEKQISWDDLSKDPRVL